MKLNGKSIAVIGGGINGICVAWEAADQGANVTLFERATIMQATSKSSSKLLHGGLRYLENIEFSLVKEALAERAWWLKNAPEFSSVLEIHLPDYQTNRRSKYTYRAGLFLYDLLAGQKNIAPHNYLKAEQFRSCNTELVTQGLNGGFVFYDGQMNDLKLGLWAANKAKLAGVNIQQHQTISKVTTSGVLSVENIPNSNNYDFIVNVAGPWSQQLLEASGIPCQFKLDLVRGSHLFIDRELQHGYFLEVPNEKRNIFVLPYEGRTLIGTTEVRQSLSDNIECSTDEAEYLMGIYNHYFYNPIKSSDIDTISGLRPLLLSSNDPVDAKRGYAIQKNAQLITVFGGKWTTSRSLARKVVQQYLV